MALKHAKTNNVPNWTQADMDKASARYLAAYGEALFPVGSTIADITLSQDWNTSHVIDAGGITFNDATVQTTAAAVAGVTTQIQYNNAGAFGGSSNLTYDPSLTRMIVGDPALLGASVGTRFNSSCNDLNANVVINAFISSGSVNTSGNVQALQFSVTDTGTNTVSTLTGINGLTIKSATGGNVVTMNGVAASARVTGGATATTLNSFSAQNRVLVGSSATTSVTYSAGLNTVTGAITNAYAFRAVGMKITNVTTGYAFASDGVSDINYMLGTLGVGNNAPSTAFHVSGPIRCASYTVATLPLAATVGNGTRAHVTDALGPVFMAAVVGGGAVYAPVYSDGTAWFVG